MRAGVDLVYQEEGEEPYPCTGEDRVEQEGRAVMSCWSLRRMSGTVSLEKDQK